MTSVLEDEVLLPANYVHIQLFIVTVGVETRSLWNKKNWTFYCQTPTSTQSEVNTVVGFDTIIP